MSNFEKSLALKAFASSRIGRIVPAVLLLLLSAAIGTAQTTTPSAVSLRLVGAGCSGACATSTYGQAIILQTTGTMGGGIMTFFIDDTILGVAPVNGSLAVTSSLTTNQLPVGTHKLKAIYSGDNNYAPFTTPSLFARRYIPAAKRLLSSFRRQ